MKKTLIISLEYPPYIGGVSTYVHNVADTLDPEKTIVLAPHHKDSEHWDSSRKYKVIRKSLLFPKFIWPRWLLMVLAVNKIVKKEKIELIMVHHVLPVGYIAILIKKLKKVPFLLFSHGTDLVTGTATPWKRNMVAMVSRQCEQIIFNSNSLQRRFLQVLPQFEKKSLVLYPCPDSRFFIHPGETIIEQLRKQFALQGKKVILSVSRLIDGKGFPHLIRLMPKILKKVPNLVWIIVGDGPKKQQIIDLIQENNLQNIVRYVGEVPHVDLSRYFYLADAFVLLTHPDNGMEEGLGLVYLEASAVGLPILAGRSGGVDEAVLDGETGRVVSIYDANGGTVVDEVAKMLTDREYADTFGKSAKERMKYDFIWEEQIKLLDPWTK